MGRGKGPSPPPPIHLPSDIIEAIARCRPVCRYYLKGYCKAGSNCKNFHGDCEAQTCHVPFVSYNVSKDGKRTLQVRPPLRPALCKKFNCSSEQLPVQRSRQIGDLTLFPLQFMPGIDKQACKAAISCGYVTVYTADNDSHRPGQATKIAKPHFIMHGTGPEEALSILDDRQVNTSGGICGEGSYGFKMKDDTDESIVEAYRFCQRSGYAKGAGIAMEVDGILINGDRSYVLPPGCIAYKNNKDDKNPTFDQFACHPSSAQCIYAVFNTEGLICALGKCLAVENYSVQFHQALMEAQKFVLGGLTPTRGRMPALRNQAVKTQEKQSGSAQSARMAQASSDVELDPQKISEKVRELKKQKNWQEQCASHQWSWPQSQCYWNQQQSMWEAQQHAHAAAQQQCLACHQQLQLWAAPAQYAHTQQSMWAWQCQHAMLAPPQAAAQQQPFNSWPAPPQPVQAAAQQQPFKIWHEPPPPPPLQPEPSGRPPFPDQTPVTWPPQSSSHHKTRSKKEKRPRSTNKQEACSSARGAQGLTQPPQLPPQRSCNDMTQQQKTELATESSAASGSQGLTYSLPQVASYKLPFLDELRNHTRDRRGLGKLKFIKLH